jgi:two-component system phosphate regulon response regulator PhoB
MEGLSKMANSKCLIVEDETAIRDLIALILVREGYQVQTVGSSHAALQLIERNQFDLMIVDWMLPELSGVDLIKTIRASGNAIPILMVTAKVQPEDIVMGLDAGADDYITKPFDANVLKARAQALIRRSQMRSEQAQSNKQDPVIYQLGEIKVNTAAYEVFVEEKLIHLTPSEYKILVEMLQNVGRVLTREFFMSKVQGEGIIVTGRTIDTHVFALRKKLGVYADYIETIRGVGYRIKNIG